MLNDLNLQHSWLITWNPSKWDWQDYNEAIISTHSGGTNIQSWTFANSNVKVNDRVYLIMLGNIEKRGIIAAGKVCKEPYMSDHYDKDKAAVGIKVQHIDVAFDWIIDKDKENILLQDDLKTLFPNQAWSPQSSGIAIKAEYVDVLEEVWQKTVDKQKVVVNMANDMQYVINRILNEYAQAKQGPFKGSELGDFIRQTAPLVLANCGNVDLNKYAIKGSVGVGNWANVPWLCIYNKSVTSTVQSGVYIAYLLSEDCKTLYLTFNQGCSELKNNLGKKQAISEMRKVANNVISKIDSRGFKIATDDKIGVDIKGISEYYENGAIFYKKYEQGAVPSEAELEEDLAKMLSIYEDYISIDAPEVPLAYPPNIVDTLKWNDYDTAIMLSDTLKVLGGISAPKQQKELSERLRSYAIDSGLTISEKFRNTNGMKFKMDEMLSLLTDEVNEGKKPSVKFQDIYTLYKSDPAKFDELLQQAEYLGPLGGIYNEELRAKLLKDFVVKPIEQEDDRTINDRISAIESYITQKGFICPPGLIKNFYLCLKAKPFVILAGTSGTGKTWLVKLFSKAIGAEYEVVPVRPDWSDSSDLLGHRDLKGEFVPGAIYDFVVKAQANPDKPFILCLDEMNLARVEYYLSDYLSVIESREFVDDKIDAKPLITAKANGSAEDIKLPENLYIVGTVNMDETTFPFSKKVLDRANTIEFNYVYLNSNIDEMRKQKDVQVELKDQKNKFLRAEYLKLQEALIADENVQPIKDYCEQLEEINQILQGANMHVGYRVRDEICFYLLYNKEYALMSQDEAFDNCLMQKILPRLQGSTEAVKNMLVRLFVACVNAKSKVYKKNKQCFLNKNKVANNVLENIQDWCKAFDKCLYYDEATDGNALDGEEAAEGSNTKISCANEDYKNAHDFLRYPKSAKKISFMLRRLEEDGYTGFWL